MQGLKPASAVSREWGEHCATQANLSFLSPLPSEAPGEGMAEMKFLCYNAQPCSPSEVKPTLEGAPQGQEGPTEAGKSIQSAEPLGSCWHHVRVSPWDLEALLGPRHL